MLKVTVQLKGEARNSFDKIHKYLENDKLTITSRRTDLDRKYRHEKHPKQWSIDDYVTIVTIVGGNSINLLEEVHRGVKTINGIYPGSALIVEP